MHLIYSERFWITLLGSLFLGVFIYGMNEAKTPHPGKYTLLEIDRPNQTFHVSRADGVSHGTRWYPLPDGCEMPDDADETLIYDPEAKPPCRWEKPADKWRPWNPGLIPDGGGDGGAGSDD